jgi:hypothetical protein
MYPTEYTAAQVITAASDGLDFEIVNNRCQLVSGSKSEVAVALAAGFTYVLGPTDSVAFREFVAKQLPRLIERDLLPSHSMDDARKLLLLCEEQANDRRIPGTVNQILDRYLQFAETFQHDEHRVGICRLAEALRANDNMSNDEFWEFLSELERQLHA